MKGIIDFGDLDDTNSFIAIYRLFVFLVLKWDCLVLDRKQVTKKMKLIFSPVRAGLDGARETRY